jgi:glycosyltransferase involved in cell wall biosynthesis
MVETVSNREWNINRDELKFPYEIIFGKTLEGVIFLKSVIKTWEKLSFLDPDVLIIGGYSYVAYWAGFFWAKLNKKKIILWSGSNEEDRDKLFLKEKLKGFLIKRCDAANVYGKRSKDYLVKLGMQKNRIFIKGNTTDNAFYYNERTRLRAKRKILCKQFGIPFHNFLYIGRLAKEKNLFFILNAYKKLNADDWGLILVGSGPLRGEIERYIKKQLIKDVFMPGFKQKEEIPQYFVVSDVFVLPSISEPWGLVVNEAMASGLPVLVSEKCGCYPDLIKEGVNGFSFDPYNIEELYGHMKNVVDGKYDLEAMGKDSLGIIKDYTPERAAKVIVDTIKFVLKK